MISKTLYEEHAKQNKLAKAEKEYRQRKRQQSIENFYKWVGGSNEREYNDNH